jgi:hypothetical protein|tara:strand:- start:322 stop:597 length:276 start_codon:yes stop_codon:yes gene_type:complete
MVPYEAGEIMFDYEGWRTHRNYVQPGAGDDVVRYDPGGEFEHRVGLLYHVDAYAGGLPRGHVVFDDGSELHDCLFIFQGPDDAANDPTWWE